MNEEVLFAQEGSLGVITLNRPSALNALNGTMICAMQNQLALWKEDNDIHAVVIRAVPGTAFCAGGDIRSIYYLRHVSPAEQREFFWHEYRLNHFIHHFGKPYIALIDGIVMGGGVGISLHGSHPIASERFLFAMPETGIGFFPDIGASYLLTRCPGYLGIYLGLTGNRLGAHDAMKAGLVKQIVSSKHMPVLYDRFMNEDLSKDAFSGVSRCIEDVARQCTPEEKGSELKPLIDECFAHSTIERIRESLQSVGEAWAAEVDTSLAKKSPLSLQVSLAQLHQAKNLTLAQCLQMDYDLVSHFLQGHDFYEGIRALLIDKDKNPKWNPAFLDEVSKQNVQDYFMRTHAALQFIILTNQSEYQ